MHLQALQAYKTMVSLSKPKPKYILTLMTMEKDACTRKDYQ